MASPRTKYKEYKRKMEEWSKLFEQEYGYAPADDDRLESNTYNALLEKARHYRSHIAEGALRSPDRKSPDMKSKARASRNASTPNGTRSKSSRSDRHGSGQHRNVSAPPMRAGRSSSRHSHPRPEVSEGDHKLRASPTKSSPSRRAHGKGTKSIGVDVSALIYRL